ncbi:MAG: hypothetical protein H6736_10260 [Alphaproteobacteria bacterium]|nr:hypothetical protein [Alphaproteobacteria bacterium]MCB9692183.1 hypothetical protein [Alphaproteobacteria bacterium]
MFRARRGLAPEPGWGAHLALPLLRDLVERLDPSLSVHPDAATWVAEVDARGVLDREPLLEVGGAFLHLLWHDGHTAIDDRYGSGAPLRADTPVVGGPFRVAFANALFEEGSGIVRTLGPPPDRAALGAAWPAVRLALARAAAVEVVLAVAQRLHPGGVFLVDNVLSPAVTVPDATLARIGMRALPRRSVLQVQTAHGRLETAVWGFERVGAPTWPVEGPAHPSGGRTVRVVYPGPGERRTGP